MLPSSVQRAPGSSIPSAISGKAELGQSSFQWTPVQKSRNEGSGHKGGEFVTTLCMDFLTRTYEGAMPYMVRVEKANFAAVGGAVWCYLVGGQCVILKGSVTGRRQMGSVSARDNVIARLPEGLRPTRPLLFAALARNVGETGGRTVIKSTMATVMASPDGDISKVGGGTPEATIDLSAIRFCTDKGISLVDQVSVHAVDVAGSRLVTLQGVLLERSWQQGGLKKQLATLPDSCRPARDLHFIVPGMSREAYHLVQVRCATEPGKAGEVLWRDSIWRRDRINLTGIIFEVDPAALQFCLHPTVDEKDVARQALIQDLHRRILRKYGGPLEYCLKKAFQITGDEELNFTQFVAATKLLGYPGHMTKLWSMLDEDQGGSVSYEELESAILAEVQHHQPTQDVPALPALSGSSNAPLAHTPLKGADMPSIQSAPFSAR